MVDVNLLLSAPGKCTLIPSGQSLEWFSELMYTYESEPAF
jgi:hypothetical protein